MPTSALYITVAEVLDQAAVLMNDAAKTDYTHDVLRPFLRMAYDELLDSSTDAQGFHLNVTQIVPILVPVGSTGIFNPVLEVTPAYPAELQEIQEVGERLAGSKGPFVRMTRLEFLPSGIPAQSSFGFWTWEKLTIRFNSNGATTAREIELKYIRGYGEPPDISSATALAGNVNSRSYLTYKTAAYAAMFIGENKERAEILDAKAEQALERIVSITNKSKQQIMTRHRPFRAAFKARGGF